jgi:hypothetical protein
MNHREHRGHRGRRTKRRDAENAEEGRGGMVESEADGEAARDGSGIGYGNGNEWVL